MRCSVIRNGNQCPRRSAARVPTAGFTNTGFDKDPPLRRSVPLCKPHKAYLDKHGTTGVWDQEEFDRENPVPPEQPACEYRQCGDRCICKPSSPRQGECLCNAQHWRGRYERR